MRVPHKKRLSPPTTQAYLPPGVHTWTHAIKAKQNWRSQEAKQIECNASKEVLLWQPGITKKNTNWSWKAKASLKANSSWKAKANLKASWKAKNFWAPSPEASAACSAA